MVLNVGIFVVGMAVGLIIWIIMCLFMRNRESAKEDKPQETLVWSDTGQEKEKRKKELCEKLWGDPTPFREEVIDLYLTLKTAS